MILIFPICPFRQGSGNCSATGHARQRIREEDGVALAPDLPADLRAHSATLDRVYEKFSLVLQKGKIEEWILQFKPEDRRSALKLVLGFSFFSQADVTRMCKQLYARLPMSEIESPIFVGFGNFGKSGSLVAYSFCKANGLSTKAFVPFEDVDRFSGGHDALILVDDFLGTGDQAIDWLTSISTTVGTMSRVFLLALVGFERAKERIENLTGVRVEIAHQLTELDKAFAVGKVYDDHYEAQSARRIFQSYGKELEPEWPLGYGHGESLAAFFYNIPNNTLPIFWSKNRNWIPLFERHESQQAKTASSAFKSSKQLKRVSGFRDYLTKHEAVFESECREGIEVFEHLNSHQLVSSISLPQQRLYSLTELGISAAISSGINEVAKVGRFCNLQPSSIYGTLEAGNGFVTPKPLFVDLARKQWKLLVLDWSDTLVDEYDLDEAICESICSSDRPREVAVNKLKLRELLADLEKEHSHLWYDYIYLCKQFGKTAKDLESWHKQNARLMRQLCNVEELVGTIRQSGLKVALSTNCVSRVLSWRVNVLGARVETLFDYVVTSEVTKSVRDKGANLDLLIKKSGVPVSEIVVAGDSFSKDILPAKLRGMSTIWVRRSFPRERSYWGTPELPIASSVYEPTRSAINGRAADLMILDIKHLVRALGLSRRNGNMVVKVKNSGSALELPQKKLRRGR